MKARVDGTVETVGGGWDSGCRVGRGVWVVAGARYPVADSSTRGRGREAEKVLMSSKEGKSAQREEQAKGVEIVEAGVPTHSLPPRLPRLTLARVATSSRTRTNTAMDKQNELPAETPGSGLFQDAVTTQQEVSDPIQNIPGTTKDTKEYDGTSAFQPDHAAASQTHSASVEGGRLSLSATADQRHVPVEIITSAPADGPASASSSNAASVPPQLGYSLDDNNRKFTIAWFWTLIVIDIIAVPLVLYFCLWYLNTGLSHNAIFSISTACLGGVSIVEYFLRFYRLWKKGSTCRVMGARRWYLDWFHWNFSIAWVFIMVELIVGTVPDEPPIRLLAMPCSSLLWWFGLEMLLEDALRFMGMRSPIRISSVPKGEPFRPGIYSIIEDVVAVDGSGGQEFRTRLNARYEASHYFRLMLHRLTLFWSFGAVGAALVTTVLIFTLGRDAAYVVGWVLPCIWAGIWTAITIPYVKWCLRREYRLWGKERA
ncbi:hypothetical protein FH972_021135 [Carpinus fangiana]|uniref:Uncharacterized protein n=1 Tax=Carpinus fangiana TaxID=176857 RepID=A0A5N6KNU1_9ROSI|nr:hypothetical protein FH972_021135 [Carpinus fangiana]